MNRAGPVGLSNPGVQGCGRSPDRVQNKRGQGESSPDTRCFSEVGIIPPGIAQVIHNSGDRNAQHTGPVHYRTRDIGTTVKPGGIMWILDVPWREVHPGPNEGIIRKPINQKKGITIVADRGVVVPYLCRIVDADFRHGVVVNGCCL